MTISQLCCIYVNSPSVVGGEGVPGSDEQLLAHSGHFRAVEHELHQGIRQLLQQRQGELREGSEQVGQEGEGLDLG